MSISVNIPTESTMQSILEAIQEQSGTQMKIAEEIADGLDVDLSEYSTTSEMNSAIQAAVEGIDLSAYSTEEAVSEAITAALGGLSLSIGEDGGLDITIEDGEEDEA